MSKLDKDDPRLHMPTMYRRQREFRDDTPVFHSEHETNDRLKDIREARDRKAVKQRKFGQILTAINIIVIAAIILFALPYLRKTPELKLGYTLETRAFLDGNRIFGYAEIALDSDTSVYAGSFIRLTSSVPAMSLTQTETDVMPTKKGEIRRFAFDHRIPETKSESKLEFIVNLELGDIRINKTVDVKKL